jgi:hypothetical protein
MVVVKAVALDVTAAVAANHAEIVAHALRDAVHVAKVAGVIATTVVNVATVRSKVRIVPMAHVNV